MPTVAGYNTTVGEKIIPSQAKANWQGKGKEEKMRWINKGKTFEGIKVEVVLSSSSNPYKSGETVYKVKVNEAKHPEGWGTVQLPFTPHELNKKLGLQDEGFSPNEHFIEDGFRNCYLYTRDFSSEEKANKFAEKVREAIKKLEEEKKGVERIKKIRRRIEDVLRKSNPEVIFRIAKELGVKID